MFGIITRSDGLELQACEPCGNLTPIHWLDDEAVCKYCFDAYPELFQFGIAPPAARPPPPPGTPTTPGARPKKGQKAQ